MNHEQKHPSDELIRQVNINLTYQILNGDGIWFLSCPEWKCEFPTGNLTLGLAMLSAELEAHNKFALLQKKEAARRRRKPDDGRKTDRRHSLLY